MGPDSRARRGQEGGQRQEGERKAMRGRAGGRQGRRGQVGRQGTAQAGHRSGQGTAEVV